MSCLFTALTKASEESNAHACAQAYVDSFRTDPQLVLCCLYVCIRFPVEINIYSNIMWIHVLLAVTQAFPLDSLSLSQANSIPLSTFRLLRYVITRPLHARFTHERTISRLGLSLSSSLSDSLSLSLSASVLLLAQSYV